MIQNNGGIVCASQPNPKRQNRIYRFLLCITKGDNVVHTKNRMPERQKKLRIERRENYYIS